MTRPFFPKGVTFKITMLTWLGSIVVLALVLSYSYFQTRNIILQEAEKSARQMTLSAARKIEQQFLTVEKIVGNLALFIETEHPKEKLLMDLLRSTLENNPEVYGSVVAFAPHAFKADQKAFAPYFYRTTEGVKFEQLGADHYNYFQRDWYHVPEVLRRPVWLDPFFDEGGGNIVMTTYAVPFFARPASRDPQRKGSGDFRGIVTADVDLNWLSQMVGTLDVGSGGQCFIISDSGTFVTHRRPEAIMTESIFTLATERQSPLLRSVGRAMTREKSGFVDVGSVLGGEDAFVAYAQIPSPGWSLAAVFPKRELFSELVKLHQIIALMASVGVCLLLVASVLVARSISRPLLQMARATKKIAAGDLKIDLSNIRSTDEVGQLAQALTSMVKGIKERDFIRDTFGRYLTREVVNRLLESEDGLRLGGQSREISIIMSDLRGFTALTSRMSPEQIIHLLNRYLGKMVDVLIEFRGTIDEIVGDGILAFFGAPEAMDDHPARAVACAVKMQLAMEDINYLNQQEGLPQLEMGIAVNTGDVVVGNIGSEKRSKYGAVGSQVNFTGRMESYTVGGQILVSPSTYERVSHILHVRNVLRVQMKGVVGEVELYDVAGIGGEYSLSLSHIEHAPVDLANHITIQIETLDEKTVGVRLSSTGILTKVSPTSAVIRTSLAIRQWADVRMRLLDERQELIEGEIYGKAVSVTVVGDFYEVLVRLTSVSPQVSHVFVRSMRRK